MQDIVRTRVRAARVSRMYATSRILSGKSGGDRRHRTSGPTGLSLSVLQTTNAPQTRLVLLRDKPYAMSARSEAQALDKRFVHPAGSLFIHSILNHALRTHSLQGSVLTADTHVILSSLHAMLHQVRQGTQVLVEVTDGLVHEHLGGRERLHENAFHPADA